MASSTASPPAATDPFDMGIHTPANLNRGARAALLQNSPATVNGTIGVLPTPGWLRHHPHHLSPPPRLQPRKELRALTHRRSLNNNQSLSSSQPMISRENTRKNTTPS
ncbi:hypothetical protein FOWG_17910 [Fusarium oxysporum f. sp. lycopersici MN25]|nr:hypothetical protein FOWG_17910 [Fusarium oxysporum f. sp. lycopersici MN25]